MTKHLIPAPEDVGARNAATTHAEKQERGIRHVPPKGRAEGNNKTKRNKF